MIPCAVESFQWTMRNRRACCVVYGEPISFQGVAANGRAYKQAAEQVRVEILRLWRQAAGAVAAGFPLELADGTRRQTWPRARDFYPAPTPRRISGLA